MQKDKLLIIMKKVIKKQLFIENYLRKIASTINNTITEMDLHLKLTGPTYRKTENNITISYNIYPDEANIEQTWLVLFDLLHSTFQELSKIGEVIFYDTASGKILDQGIEYFTVLRANVFECYIYEPESFVYARLLEEFDKIKKNTWISIDIDGIERSAWFVE